MVGLWDGAVVGETGQTDPATATPEKLDQWHDFRKSVALVSMVLFFFCVVGLGFLVYQLAIVGDDDGTFSAWSFFRFMSVAVPSEWLPWPAWVSIEPAPMPSRNGAVGSWPSRCSLPRFCSW